VFCQRSPFLALAAESRCRFEPYLQLKTWFAFTTVSLVVVVVVGAAAAAGDAVLTGIRIQFFYDLLHRRSSIHVALCFQCAEFFGATFLTILPSGGSLICLCSHFVRRNLRNVIQNAFFSSESRIKKQKMLCLKFFWESILMVYSE
jgi:hypothetical protein